MLGQMQHAPILCLQQLKNNQSKDIFVCGGYGVSMHSTLTTHCTPLTKGKQLEWSGMFLNFYLPTYLLQDVGTIT